MLWIEYDSISPCNVPTVKTVLENIARLIRPFPVAAYDTQKLGIGLLVHDGIYPGYDDESESSTSSNLSREISPWSTVEAFAKIPTDPSDTLASVEDVMEDGVFSSSDFVAESANAMDVHVDNDQGNERTDGGSQGADIGAVSSGYNSSPEGSRNFQFINGDSGGGNDEDDDEDDDTSPPTPPADPPLGSDLCIPSGTFTGRTKLDFGSSRTQELSISFDLQIQPSHQRGKINCAISLDNLVVRASPPETVTATPKSVRYITDRVAITVGPSGRCYPPTAVTPQDRDFVERHTTSMRTQIGAGIEASIQPSFTLQGTRSVGKSIDHRPITLAVEPISIGAGQGDDICWFYRTHSRAETHLELSSKNPPTHEVSYRISPTSNTPDNFRIQVEAFYHLRRIPRRFESSFSPRFRFLKDVIARDFIMTLEVNITKEGRDNFVFPGMNKEGCDLDLELYVREGFSRQGKSGGRGSVKSQLNTATKCA